MPPVLLGIGLADTVVMPKQSQLFYQTARDAGAQQVVKMELENAGHGYESVGGTITPTVQQFNQEAYRMIRQWMGL